MNVLSLLIPKKDVQFLYEDFTIRQSLEKMEFHKYGTIPVIDRRSGKYLYSVREGDFLWYLKDNNMNFSKLNTKPLKDVPCSRNIVSVSVDADLSELYFLAGSQNYVPVVDDIGVFIGIVTRKSIMNYTLQRYKENKENLLEEE